MPPARWLGPTQQGMGLGSAPCHCVGRREAKAGYERPRGGRTEPAFKQSGASIPRLPRSPQNTGEFINALRERCQTHHPPSHQPLPGVPPRDMPLARWLGPTQQGVGPGPWQQTLPLCLDVVRDLGVDGYTFRYGLKYGRYEPGYVHIRTWIRADTNLDTCRYAVYVQIRTNLNIRIGVRTLIRMNT